jgi:hypothetical protein
MAKGLIHSFKCELDNISNQTWWYLLTYVPKSIMMPRCGCHKTKLFTVNIAKDEKAQPLHVNLFIITKMLLLPLHF